MLGQLTDFLAQPQPGQPGLFMMVSYKSHTGCSKNAVLTGLWLGFEPLFLVSIYWICSFWYGFDLVGFYAQKQLLLSAHLSHRSSIRLSVHLSVCLSVCLSHRWLSQKSCKIGSPNYHCRLPGRL